MKKKIIASVIAALLSTTALADTSSMNASVTGMGILENSYIRAGVNGIGGSFGSGGNTTPGLLFDSTGTGTFNTGYDYLTPGSPFDGFSVMIDGTNYSNNNGRSNSIIGDGNGLTDGTNSLSWTGGVAGVFNITNIYSLGATTPYIDITSQITMGTAATDVWFSRHIDPDARAAAGDSSATDNVLGYGVIPDSNVAFSEALSSRYALGLYSTDSNVDAGISGWSQAADAYTSNTVDGSGNTNTGDNTIGLSWHWTSVNAGDILTASYAYIFGPSAFDAANDAIAGGAGGGADVSSWGTLTDVGSATDAASGTPAAPTLVSTSSPTTSYGSWSAWTTNTALPILTQSQTTHDASDDGKVQTIDRETTTIVTTPEQRTRTTTTTVVDTYSDSSTVTRTIGTGTETDYQTSAISTVTDPGSFVGRIDQMSTANDMLSMANRSLSFDGVNFVRDNNKMDNGMSGGVTGITVGGTRELDNGWSIGAGVGKLSTSVRNDGSADVDTTMVNVHGGRSIDLGTINFGLTHAMNDYTSSRTIGDFANTSKTSGTDTWANVTFIGNGEKVRPVLGVTRGVRKTDGYTEAGSIQSARTVADATEHYTFGTIGAQATLTQGVIIEALHHTDGVNSLALMADKEIQKDTRIVVKAARNMSDFGSANSIMLGLVKKF
jgi:hypothetical protein